MFRQFDNRWGHYLLLLAATTALFLPNLGGPSLWDIDEGNNAEAAREMLVSGNWIVPTFNYQLRVDKPALLYWCQIGAYRAFGVGEFAARLPSALAAMIAVLLTYELGRSMFGPASGLLAGIILASAGLFCATAQFANPDMLLNASTLLSFFIFWRSFASGGRSWFGWLGVSTGLGFLAKGPVALVLPAAVILLFLLWTRQLRRLLDRRLLLGGVLFAVVALPWYGLVGAETRGEFLRGFFLQHNQQRFLASMEGHRGPIYYHLISLLIGFAPWSAFLAPTLYYAIRHLTYHAPLTTHPSRLTTHHSPLTAQHSSLSTHHSALTTNAHRFLCCWVIVYLAFFSASATKLPNYILPLYPALALLTARFLDDWRLGTLPRADWVMPVSLACLLLVGVGTVAGLLIAGGAVKFPLLRGRSLSGLETAAAVGVFPVAGAAAGWWLARRRQRTAAVIGVASSAILFVGLLLTFGSAALDSHKAPRHLVHSYLPHIHERETRVACYDYFQPSLVFYCRREVTRLTDETQVLEFLQSPWLVYLFVPQEAWVRLERKVGAAHRQLGSHWDLYRQCAVVVVTNE